MIGSLLLTFCLFAPGFALLHAKRFCDNKRLSLKAEERIFYSIILSIAISSCFLIALLPFSLVSVLNLFLVDLVFIVLVLMVSKGLELPSFHVDPRAIVPIILLVIICVALFSHPSQEMSARHDIGVYLNTGIEIGRTGSIAAHDTFMEGIPDEYLQIFYSMYDDPSNSATGKQFPDMAITDASKGSVLPIQPPLFQTWVGVFYSAFGITGVTWVSPLFAALSVIGIFFLTRTAFGHMAAIISSSLLAICFSQVFFAQYSSPEILFQMLVVYGVLFFILMWKTPSLIWSISSALCIGLLFFVRIDAIMIVLPVATILFLSAWHNYLPKHWKAFILLTALLMASFIAYAFTNLRPYIDQMATNISIVYEIPLTLEISMVIFILALLAFLILPFVLVARGHVQETSDSIKHRIPWKLVGFFMAAYLTLLVLSSGEIGLIKGLPRGSVDPILVLATFISPFALAMGIIGMFITMREKNLVGFLIIGVTSLFLLMYLFTIPNNPAFPWLTRRHITVVTPIFFILTGYCISFIWAKAKRFPGKRSVAVKGLAIGLVAAMTIWSAMMLPTLTTTQFDGYSDQIAEIAKDYDENDVILDSGMFTDVSISMNLKYGYDLNAIYLWNLTPSSDIVNETLDWMIEEGYDVFFFSVSESRLNNYFHDVNNYSLVKVNEYTIHIDKLVWENMKFTNQRTSSDMIITVYQIIPKV